MLQLITYSTQLTYLLCLPFSQSLCINNIALWVCQLCKCIIHETTHGRIHRWWPNSLVSFLIAANNQFHEGIDSLMHGGVIYYVTWIRNSWLMGGSILNLVLGHLIVCPLCSCQRRNCLWLTKPLLLYHEVVSSKLWSNPILAYLRSTITDRRSLAGYSATQGKCLVAPIMQLAE